VINTATQYDATDEECNGGRSELYSELSDLGYETPDGSFAQFTETFRRSSYATPQAPDMGERRATPLTLATAYRMLFGHEPPI